MLQISRRHLQTAIKLSLYFSPSLILLHIQVWYSCRPFYNLFNLHTIPLIAAIGDQKLRFPNCHRLLLFESEFTEHILLAELPGCRQLNPLCEFLS